MNSNDINSIINNLCDKLGTTASKLIPEMASYQIAKHSIWMVVSLIFIGVAIGLTIRLLWMRKNDLYPDQVRELDEIFRETGMYDKQYSYTREQWEDVVSKSRRVTAWMRWDELTWVAMTLTAIWSGLMGIVIFGISLYHIIGWCIAPNASAFMWIMQLLGGGQ